MALLRLAVVCLTLVLLPCERGLANIKPVAFDAARNQVIARMLTELLPAHHYSHHPVDNELSQRVFTLFLRRLDPRKRFLLKSDVEELTAFSSYIDEELARGRMVLPSAGMQMFNQRLAEVMKMVDPILDQGFDPQNEEFLESDLKKIVWAADAKALRDRWRRVLKMQVIEEYFSGLEVRKDDETKLRNSVSDSDVAKSEAWKEALEKVRKRTHAYLRRLQKDTRQDYFNRYFEAVARAFDPHTDYMPPTVKEDFDIHMSGSLEGIGALLREDDGHIKVVRIIPGSAAARQGQLQAEDTIVSVAEQGGEPVDIADMRLREAVSYIRGPKGSAVVLTVIKPDGRKQVITIVRDVVQIEETYVKSTMLRTGRGQKIGYVKIPSFYRDFNGSNNGRENRNVTDDTRHALATLKADRVEGLILDLRNNGGGALVDAVNISGLFLPGGPVVQVRNSEGNMLIMKDKDPSVSYGGPLIVLVNQFSASASEILAAAMQDYGRAFILGSRHTHGKGTVQNIRELNQYLPIWHLRNFQDLGALKITIQKFYRITGGSTQFRGVEPDLVAPTLWDYMKSGERYLDYSLPWDTVQSIDHRQWQGPHIDRDRAARLGKKWVENNATFDEIRQEVERARQRSQETLIRISLQGLRQQRQEAKKARERARSAGLLDEDVEDRDKGEKTQPLKLEEKLSRDPYVGLALYLFEQAISR